jgi:hypothetical protein
MSYWYESSTMVNNFATWLHNKLPQASGTSRKLRYVLHHHVCSSTRLLLAKLGLYSRFSPSHTNPPSALYCVNLFLATPSHSDFLPEQMDQSPSYTTGTTCIPSLFPPGVDPNTVDFRTFFPYIPTEVTHRKRTSHTQLKVLEDIFRKDTKPNAVLHKKLAAELDMLPCAVQVCYILLVSICCILTSCSHVATKGVVSKQVCHTLLSFIHIFNSHILL